MKNVIKVRIIYDSAHVAEKEYLRKFFQFIGCLVFEQYIDLGIKKLCSLASDEVLIALNFYREKRLYALWMERQFYLYFDLNDGFVCLSKEKPLPSQYWNQKEENSKRDIRRKALEILIEAIWEGEEGNKKAIKDILECYITKDGDVSVKDLARFRRYLLDYINLDNAEEKAADSNIDGEVGIKDLVALRKLILE